MHLMSDPRVQSILATGLGLLCSLPGFGLLFWLASLRRCWRARGVTFPVYIGHAFTLILASVAVAMAIGAQFFEDIPLN